MESRIQTGHSRDDFSLFHNLWALGWKIQRLGAGIQSHILWLVSVARLAVALGWNTHIFPPCVAWDFSQNGSWIPKLSLLRVLDRNCQHFLGPSLEVTHINYAWIFLFNGADTNPFPDSRWRKKYDPHLILGHYWSLIKKIDIGINMTA